MSQPTSQRFAGKVALVTGSSRGIGRAVAIALGKEGASVVVNYSGSKDAALATASEITKFGSKAIVVQADVGSTQDNKRLVEATVKEFGRIDILVLNAALMMLGKDINNTTEEDFDKAFGVNVKGPFFTIQAAQKHIPEGGRIILFSTSLTINSMITPNYLLYNSTKGAIEQMMRLLAKDLGKRNVTVNTISPGPTETDGYYEGKTEQVVKMVAGTHPAGRIARVDEIASGVLYLASPEAQWVNGHIMRVNGGMAV